MNLNFLKYKPEIAHHQNSSVRKRGFSSMTMFLIISCVLIEYVKCDCSQNPLQQTMYINSSSSCTFFYDSCSSNAFMRCQKMYCPGNGLQCTTQLSLISERSCSHHCCGLSSDPVNANQKHTLKVCEAFHDASQAIEDSSSFVGGYVLVALIAVTFVVILIGFCVCKKYRNEQLELDQLNQNNPDGIPATCVDLNGYDINAEGPYFVNSNDTCAICLEKHVNLRTHCNHFYHGNCLLAWIKKKANNPCPLCMGTTYNPVKVYCQECHCGDVLVNIHPQTTAQIINEYDSHKCQNCKCAGVSSFVFSEQEDRQNNGENEKDTKFAKKIQQKNKDQKNELGSKNEQNASQRSKRKHRKVQSLKNIQLGQQKQKENQVSHAIESSAKKFHPDYSNDTPGL